MQATRKIILTEDGSHTVSIPELGITYHSTRGAIQESRHVFIDAGLHTAFRQFPEGDIRVFEMGFGTGLNAFLTALESAQANRIIQYEAIEQYPIQPEEVSQLNYTDTLGHEALFSALHHTAWNAEVIVSESFQLKKLTGSLEDTVLTGLYQVIYYDAFAPDAQPALWTEAVFKKLYDATAEGGVLTTYCSKGSVRRAMQAAGFAIKKIPGPPGKREMVQAFKKSSAETV